MKVPFLDLKAQYQSIKPEIQSALNQVLDNTAFAGGPFVAQFEKEYAAFCGAKHAVGVGSGTDAGHDGAPHYQVLERSLENRNRRVLEIPQ